MSTQTSHSPLELTPEQTYPCIDNVADHLSLLASSIGYDDVPREHFVALAELVSNKSIEENDPQFTFKTDIVEAFHKLSTGFEVEQKHIVLAGLCHLVRKRRTAEVTDEPLIRAKAMANMLLMKAAGADINLAVALPRVVGISSSNRN